MYPKGLSPMKATFNFALFLVVIVVMGSVTLCRGQESAGVYDPSTETTVKGTIEQVKTAFLPGGGASAQAREESSGPTYVNLKTDSGTLAVFLGPSWFLESKGFKFAKGDQIEVTGSKRQDKDVIIAREVKRGDQTLVVRNAQGIPAWSGGR
jgi:hypothetical protein